MTSSTVIAKDAVGDCEISVAELSQWMRVVRPGGKPLSLVVGSMSIEIAAAVALGMIALSES